MTTPEMVSELRKMIGDGPSQADAFYGEIADRLEALHSVSCPVEELKDSWPVVLYFETQAERDDFFVLVKSTHPNLKERKL